MLLALKDWTSLKDFKPIMKLNGEEFNQQFDNLIAKHPEIKTSRV